ncbi:hypothetical protein [Sphingomonas sp.]|uniref:hypothetical protein n=1 Tax=Sphingomonas sp. TaxID=28214 RepID=UPI00356AC3AE
MTKNDKDLHEIARGPEKFWERSYYNSYGNYHGYRFQDFRAGCEHRDDKHGGCNPSCKNPDHPYATWEPDYRECCCDNCPMVEKDYDDEDPDAPDYSEGEQPILVLKPQKSHGELK